MKMTKRNYEYLKEAIQDAIKHAERVSGKSIEQWRQEYLRDGLTEKRFRWDLFWMSKSYIQPILWDKILDGLMDDHIDTALKRIVKELSKEALNEN